MKIVDIKEDIFTSLEPGDALAHGANCTGVMGAGIARPIKYRFPQNFKRYKSMCDNGMFVPGDVLHVDEGGYGIYNLATQFWPGPCAKEEYIKEAVSKMSLLATINNHTTVKTVRLGCGLGGLDYGSIRRVLKGIDSAITLEVYYL